MIGYMDIFKFEYLLCDCVSEMLYMLLLLEQVLFVGYIVDFVFDDNLLCDFYVVWLDGMVVGFFKVEIVGYVNEMLLVFDYVLGFRMVMVDQV